jgi:hypothetical protein
MRRDDESEVRPEFTPDWRPESYWPGDENEVEIASLYLASRLGNTIRILARQESVGIAFRAEDDYGGTLIVAPAHAPAPFSNSELMETVKKLEWQEGLAKGPVWVVRDREAAAYLETAPLIDVSRAAEFISGESTFYPAFEGLVEDDNRAWAIAFEHKWVVDNHVAFLREAIEQLRAVILEGEPAPRNEETYAISLEGFERERIDPRLRELFESQQGSTSADDLAPSLADEFPLEVGLWAVVAGETARAHHLLSEIAASDTDQAYEAKEGLAMIALLEGDDELASTLWDEAI